MDTAYGNFSDEDIKLCVKLGSAWMDDFSPNWAHEIKLDELNMSSCTECIIGQAVGDYDDILNDLGLSDDWAAENGFFAPNYYDDKGKYDDEATAQHYQKLELAWTTEVRNRLDK